MAASVRMSRRHELTLGAIAGPKSPASYTDVPWPPAWLSPRTTAAKARTPFRICSTSRLA